MLNKKILHRYMSGKIFLTPEVWEKVLTQTIKSPIPRTKVQWSTPENWKKADRSHKWKEGVQKNVQFSFCTQTKAFRYEMSFEEFNVVSVTAGPLARLEPGRWNAHTRSLAQLWCGVGLQLVAFLSGQGKWRRLAGGRFGFIALYLKVAAIYN